MNVCNVDQELLNSYRSGFALNMLDFKENYDVLHFCLNKYFLIVGHVLFPHFFVVCLFKLFGWNARCVGVANLYWC